MAFATTSDVSSRLGRTLTAAETDSAALTISIVQSLIAAEAGRDDAWATALSPVPAYFRALCIEKAISAIANPSNIASTSETLGAFSHSETYPRAQDGGALLSDEESTQVRRVIYGSGIASPHLTSFLDDLPDPGAGEELPI